MADPKEYNFREFIAELDAQEQKFFKKIWKKQSVGEPDSSLSNPPPPPPVASIKTGEVKINEKSDRKVTESEVVKEGSSEVPSNGKSRESKTRKINVEKK
ncbi:hypothetical protein HAX54_012044 [Datura stramonium]|uniref:Uncharacterized protein n=1 Tax=Datura stramonium TaxID=4076 RepID=A0ABS8Y0V1_DATST|nr:hypothetical protein [Datura stramonium]